MREKGEKLMTTKPMHTPGPWELTGRTLYGNTRTGRIVTLHSGDDQTFEANARLIAAAPELLEAAKNFLSELKNPVQDVTMRTQRRKELEAIISKAEAKRVDAR